jgi:RNA polymerase sigma-70 factor (ECF subfamily)
LTQDTWGIKIGRGKTFSLSPASLGVKLRGIPITDRSDALLVRDVRAGSAEAFNVLVRRWERKVYSYLVYVTGQSEDAFDLCQEVFIAAYANIGRLRAPEKFRPWLFQIAHNTAYSHLRKERGGGAVPYAVDPGSVSPALRRVDGALWERAELKLLVEKALAALPVDQREAIVLKFYQGFKFDEIAEIQDCPVSTIKTRFYAGFDQLRKILKS